MDVSEKALKTLYGIQKEPGFISIKHAGALRNAGYIEKAETGDRRPGYVFAKITAAGLARV